MGAGNIRPYRSKVGFAATGAVMLVLLLLALRVPTAYSFSTGQGASIVLGQTGFLSSTAATTASGLHGPYGMAFDSSGNFWVGDYWNNRVVEYPKGSGFTTGESASLVIGQSGFGSGGSATTATGENGPIGVAFDSSGNMWVGEINNNRVVMYPKGSGFTTGEAATVVIGQTGFTSLVSATTATGLYGPESIAIDPAGNLWVADFGNNRVLEYLHGAGFTTGQAASLVLGQADFTSGMSHTTATGMSGPAGIAFDSSGNVWISDLYNNRVLEYLKGSGFTNGESASLVLGQSDFTSSGSATTATALSEPIGLAFDSSGNLWVGDIGNNRVLEFLKGGGFTTGQAASLAICQPDFVTPTSATTASGCALPQGIIFDASGNLWVADQVNNRVLGFAVSLQGVTTSTSVSSTTSTATVTETTTSVSTETRTTLSTATTTSVSTETSVVTETSVSTFVSASPTTVTSVSTATTTTSAGFDLTTTVAIAGVALIVGLGLGYVLKRR